MLNAGQIAPDFVLPVYENGESRLYDQTDQTAVLVFYKFSCGTTRFTFPFLEKIYRAYGDRFYFVAIAQDPAEKIKEFREALGVTIPTLRDQEPYPVSRSYQITSVPSIFLIDPDHRIKFSSHGFVKEEILNLSDMLAEKSRREQIDVFESQDVPDMKPG